MPCSFKANIRAWLKAGRKLFRIFVDWNIVEIYFFLQHNLSSSDRHMESWFWWVYFNWWGWEFEKQCFGVLARFQNCIHMDSTKQNRDATCTLRGKVCEPRSWKKMWFGVWERVLSAAPHSSLGLLDHEGIVGTAQSWKFWEGVLPIDTYRHYIQVIPSESYDIFICSPKKCHGFNSGLTDLWGQLPLETLHHLQNAPSSLPGDHQNAHVRHLLRHAQHWKVRLSALCLEQRLGWKDVVKHGGWDDKCWKHMEKYRVKSGENI